ncbi:MAG: hypothetical protein LBK69_05590, partial [Syntrophomonadaceae bacterium]|nr:hypothetical protein [Syntrophomonadaceae bacterium]
KTGLAVSYYFLARVAVLDDKIIGVARKFIINDLFAGIFEHLDRFVDLNKMIVDVKTTVFAGEFALSTTLEKLRHSVYFNSAESSRANRYSPPSSRICLISSNRLYSFAFRSLISLPPFFYSFGLRQGFIFSPDIRP